jgi:hypothetical protein
MDYTINLISNIKELIDIKMICILRKNQKNLSLIFKISISMIKNIKSETAAQFLKSAS